MKIADRRRSVKRTLGVGLAGAALLALAGCSSSQSTPQCQTISRRTALPGLSTVAGSVMVSWADGTSVSYPVVLGSSDPAPGTCSFGVHGVIHGSPGGTPFVDPNTADVGCADATPGYAWQLLFQAWQPISETAMGATFSSAQPILMRRSASPTTSAQCQDAQTPSTVNLTVSQSVGSYDFASSTVSPDYLRAVDIQITAGPSSCDLVSATLALTGEQKSDQFVFVDATDRVCPE